MITSNSPALGVLSPPVCRDLQVSLHQLLNSSVLETEHGTLKSRSAKRVRVMLSSYFLRPVALPALWLGKPPEALRELELEQPGCNVEDCKQARCLGKALFLRRRKELTNIGAMRLVHIFFPQISHLGNLGHLELLFLEACNELR